MVRSDVVHGAAPRKTSAPCLVSPKTFEPILRQRCVARCILDIAMAQVGLQRSRVMPSVGQRIATGMSQHMRVNLDPQLCSTPSSLDHSREARSAQRRTTLAHEDKRCMPALALMLAECPHLSTGKGMRSRRAVLNPANM
jgi:hypothetical protein